MLSSFAESGGPAFAVSSAFAFLRRRPAWESAYAFFTIQKANQKANRVIPTEAAHSLIVSGAVEGPRILLLLLFLFLFFVSFLFLLSSFAESGGPAFAVSFAFLRRRLRCFKDSAPATYGSVSV